MPDRLVVDLLSVTGRRGGTETYARELLSRLPAYLPHTEFIALANRVGADRVRSYFPGEVRALPWVGADSATWALGAVFAVNRAARAARADALWCPANFGPIRRGTPRVVTVHDAIYHEVHRGLLSRATRSATSWLMTRSAMSADAVVTVSETAGRAIAQNMRVPEERITVVPNGSSAPSPSADPWRALARLGLSPARPVALSTGNRMPHKNFSGLLTALTEIPAHVRPVTVIAGSAAPDPLAAEVERLGLGGDVVLPGWVDDEQLEALFQVASVYVCPSLAEGFGLPVIDALRRGVPVVANDIPVLREVGGTLASYTDAADPRALGDAIARTISTPPRAGWRADAEAWGASFTWDRAAQETALILRRALEGQA